MPNWLSPSNDVKDFLVTDTTGTFGTTTPYSIYVSKEPTKPDAVITVLDVGGFAPSPKWNIDEPTVMVRVRGPVFGYQDAYSKAADVQLSLLGRGPETKVSGTTQVEWVGMYQIGDIDHTGYDDNNRPIFNLIFRCVRRTPATGGHRSTY